MRRSGCLAVMLWCAAAPAMACTLTWTPSTSGDVVGYRVYEASPAGAYLGAKAQVPAPPFDCGPETDGQRHVFHVSAVDTSGNESGPSNEVSKLFAQVIPPTDAPRIALSPNNLTFSGLVGTGPLAAMITVSNVGTGTLDFSWSDSIPWISAGHPAGTLAPGASQTLTISAIRDGLAAGSYSGLATIQSLTAPPVTLSIAMVLTDTTPTPVPPVLTLEERIAITESELAGICRAAKAMGGNATTLAGRLRKEMPCL